MKLVEQLPIHRIQHIVYDNVCEAKIAENAISQVCRFRLCEFELLRDCHFESIHCYNQLLASHPISHITLSTLIFNCLVDILMQNTLFFSIPRQAIAQIIKFDSVNVGFNTAQSEIVYEERILERSI